MKKSTKMLLITAVSLISVGSLILIGSAGMVEQYPVAEPNFSVNGLTIVKEDKPSEANSTSAEHPLPLENKEIEKMVVHEVNKDFKRISIDVDTSDISFAITDDASCRVEYTDNTAIKHSIVVRNETLFIEADEEHKWISSKDMKLCVYLPKKEYQSLSIETDTGSIDVSALQLGSAELSSDTGKIMLSSLTVQGLLEVESDTGNIDLSAVTCKNLNAENETGKIILSNVVASSAFNIENETGDVEFKNCDAATVKVHTSTGDISGTFTSEKVFSTKTATGDVNVPNSSSGGRCEIRTGTGDINIQISK